MDKHIWETDGWENFAEFYHEADDSYYCQTWTIFMANEGEWHRLGNLNTVKQLISLSK